VQANSLVLGACIAEFETMRYTPSGLPALNLRLEHESRVSEAGSVRTVKLVMKAVAFGTLAERLAKQAVGSVWQFSGFMANARQGKSVVFHIQEFLQN
jgi:primosomal replication protein N